MPDWVRLFGLCLLAFALQAPQHTTYLLPSTSILFAGIAWATNSLSPRHKAHSQKIAKCMWGEGTYIPKYPSIFPPKLLRREIMPPPQLREGNLCLLVECKNVPTIEDQALRTLPHSCTLALTTLLAPNPNIISKDLTIPQYIF